jgi:3-methyl-2-oxobutanoate hydroxymethyltransferase
VAKKTILDFQEMKKKGEKIVYVTGYNAQVARLEEAAGVDMILVGDSVGNTDLGYASTIPVTMEEMLVFCKAVRRGAQDTFVVGDMPFMSYQGSITDAVYNAGRLIKEAEMDAVKLEGGAEMAPVVEAMTRAGMLVMGHIGLTPQSAGQFGGWRAQGRDPKKALSLVKDALALENAGAFSVLLEGVPPVVSDTIRQRSSVPILGIGAGSPCDGQLLIIYDLVGMFQLFTPKFVKKYGNLAEDIKSMVGEYCSDVRQGAFPGKEHAYGMPPEAEAEFRRMLKEDLGD